MKPGIQSSEIIASLGCLAIAGLALMQGVISWEQFEVYSRWIVTSVVAARSALKMAEVLKNGTSKTAANGSPGGTQ